MPTLCCAACARFRSPTWREQRADLAALPCVHVALGDVLATGQPARAEYLTALGQWAGGCDGEVELRPHVAHYTSSDGNVRDVDIRLFAPGERDLRVSIHWERNVERAWLAA